MDRIGALPDDLLSLVLSFLATKDAVQSSVLSRRWRRLYRSVTSLDLNDGMQSSKKKLRGVVCRVLMPRYMPKIEKLRFRCDCVLKIDTTYVREWITGFVCYEVRELELMLTNCEVDMLPHCLFNSPTLVVLKLGFLVDSCHSLRIPMLVFLSCLRVLHLEGVQVPEVILLVGSSGVVLCSKICA
ncbi:hypothetical protein Drorol1_Dr00014915 [Drosera rotundifolia]